METVVPVVERPHPSGHLVNYHTVEYPVLPGGFLWYEVRHISLPQYATEQDPVVLAFGQFHAPIVAQPHSTPVDVQALPGSPLSPDLIRVVGDAEVYHIHIIIAQRSCGCNFMVDYILIKRAGRLYAVKTLRVFLKTQFLKFTLYATLLFLV